eukprot:24702-Pelagomonas_calceolata.AAC.1
MRALRGTEKASTQLKVRGAGLASGVATEAHREGTQVCACFKDLVAASCAEINFVGKTTGTVKCERVGKPFNGDHAPFMKGRPDLGRGKQDVGVLNLQAALKCRLQP